MDQQSDDLIAGQVAKNVLDDVNNVEHIKVVPTKTAAMEGLNITAPLKSAAFQKALFNQIPLDFVAKKQKKQFNAVRVERFFFTPGTSDDQIKKFLDTIDGVFVGRGTDRHGNLLVCVVMPDHDVIDRAIDKVYKLMGAYAPEKHELFSRPLEDLPDEELERALKEGMGLEIPPAQAVIDAPNDPQ